MKAESVGFYLENLLPGIVILFCILILLPAPAGNAQAIMAQWQASEFLLSALFLSVAYLLGLISAMLSRLLVDNLSEWLPRPLFLALSTVGLRHRSYEELRRTLESLAPKSTMGQSELAEQLVPLSDKESHNLLDPTVRQAWNRIYRATLSEAMRSCSEKAVAEVQRRREQGRLVRNLFFPFVVGGIAVPRLLQVSTNMGGSILLVCGMAIFSILLYAYAEYFTYAEASLQVKKAAPEASATIAASRKIQLPS